MASKIAFSISNMDDELETIKTRTDRFIHSRNSFEELYQDYSMSKRPSIEQVDGETENDENKLYSKLIKNNLKVAGPKTRIKTSQELLLGDCPLINTANSPRTIPKVPFKVLDAPMLQDDYYLNVLDWGEQNILSVALGNTVYLWAYSTNKVQKLMNVEEPNHVTSITWEKNGESLAIGELSGQVQLWDVNKMVRLIKYNDHSERVGCVSLFGGHLLSGSRDKMIKFRDLRVSEPVKVFTGHTQEVCGLKWSPDGNYFVSGGNDNRMFVFSPKTTIPLMKKTHKAAVKAIAWSEKLTGVFASGSGSADKCLRLWNLSSRKLTCIKDTGSQICNVIFSKHHNEVITTHGFSNNEISIFNVPDLKKTHSLFGHTSRVLYLAMSKDGNSIVTGAGDETLRFWNLNYKLDVNSLTAEQNSKMNKESIFTQPMFR